jgi:hypothetical protein
VRGYVGADLKQRLRAAKGFLGFTSESHFVEFAIEQAVELAEKDIESINKV